MNELKSQGKSFEISKREVWEAFREVKRNKGAPGVDGVTIAAFETDLKNNLYKIWNRMSSGSYFPPPVRAVEIPKPIGWRRPWWLGIWGSAWTGSSTTTRSGIGLTGRRCRRSSAAGNAVGSGTG
jgi:hypothetical protein